MRLISTTILWAATTALARQDSRDRDSFTSRAGSPTGSSDNKMLVSESVLQGLCIPHGPTLESDSWIFRLNISQSNVEFKCDWKASDMLRLRSVKLRQFNSQSTSLAVWPSPNAPGVGGVGATGSTTAQSAMPSIANIVQVGQRGSSEQKNKAESVRRQSAVTLLASSSSIFDQKAPPFQNGKYIQIFGAPKDQQTAAYLELVWETEVGPNNPNPRVITSFTAPFGIIDSVMNAGNLSKTPNLGSNNPWNAAPFPDVAGSGAAVEGSLPKPPSVTDKTSGGTTGGNLDSNNGGKESNIPNLPSTPANPTAEAAPNSGPGGLSQGAIIGIAVAAAVVGLALIGFLVFWLIRRRRRRGLQQGDHVSPARPYHRDQNTATADLMGEKEAAAGGMGESPHSPYSDDGHGSLPRGIAAPGAAVAVGVAAGAGAASAHHGSSSPAPAPADIHRSSFTPYSDDGSGIPSSIHPDGDGATGSRSETPGGRYEHLMEQGMSAEDRAKVEEEERQLDAEIERAKK